jgi:TRAP-type C4-dicarboxylate transport system substrate-binding protein
MDVHTGNTPVRTLGDFKGLKLRASSRTIARTIESLGATPVSMPPAQMTEAIAKGVVDGAMATWEVVPATKLDEVTRFHSASEQGQPAFGYTVLSMLMNKRKYDRMSDDLKDILDRNSGKALSVRFGKAWDEQMAKARKSSAQDSIVAIAASDYRAMQQATAAVPEQWAEEVAGKGLDGKALLEGVRSLSSVKR